MSVSVSKILRFGLGALRDERKGIPAMEGIEPGETRGCSDLPRPRDK